MAYTINRWDGEVIAVIEDGTVNQTLPVKIIGKNYAGYGEIQNENTVHMLENFAGPIAPANAIRGQLWYDTVNKKIKYYTGIEGTTRVWKATGGADFSATAPISPNVGDLWFDTTRDQLKVRITDEWLAIGPQSAGSGVTQMISLEVKGIPSGGGASTLYSVIAATINDRVVYVIAEDEFTLDTTDAETLTLSSQGYTLIKRGITLQNTDSNGVSTSSPDHYFWGTASHALRLGDYPAADYVRSVDSLFTERVRFLDPGYTVGNSDDLAVYIDETNGLDPIIQNVTGPRITFKAKDGSNVRVPLIVDGESLSIRPGINDFYNVGTSTHKWANVYATNFIGTASRADELRVGDSYYITSTSAVASTVVARRSDGTISASGFNGNATSATKLETRRTINDVPFDGTSNIIIEDSTKLYLTGGTLTGYLTLHAGPTNALHAATKGYVDGKFGVGGILPIASGGTGAATAANARTNLNVPARDGSDATGIWNISISGHASTATSATTATNATNATNASNAVSANNAALLNNYAESEAATANTIARRDASGNLSANVFNGIATTARYADLAEKYLADKEYEPGTVVVIGGEKEVTACASGQRAVGVVSTNPAYMMNSELEGGTYIALKGRVPCKVDGAVRKGQRLIAGPNGTARGATGAHVDIFAIALEDSNAETATIEVLVL